jgi:hypothetical protein
MAGALAADDDGSDGTTPTIEGRTADTMAMMFGPAAPPAGDDPTDVPVGAVVTEGVVTLVTVMAIEWAPVTVLEPLSANAAATATTTAAAPTDPTAIAARRSRPPSRTVAGTGESELDANSEGWRHKRSSGGIHPRRGASS